MNRLTLDDVKDALPDLEELRPIFDHLLTGSEPDSARAWSGSGLLGTLGSRLVTEEALRASEVEGVAALEAARLGEVYARMARALSALTSGDRIAAAHALLEAAALEEARERPARAEAYAAAAYRASRGERDRRPAALALRRWARACRALGELTTALDHYERSYETASAMSDARGAAEAAIGAGNVLEEQGKWGEAAERYSRALTELEAVDEPVPERWHALLNLHIVTRSSGAVDDSLAWLEQAERAAADVDARAATPFMDNARGQLEMARGAFTSAEHHFRSAVDAQTAARPHVSFRLNLAEALLAQGRNLDAAEHAREAEREAIRASLVPKLPEVYRLLGRIASAENNADAFVLFERALEIIRDRRLPGLEEALTLQAYAASEVRRGDLDAARQLHTKAIELFASLGMAQMRQTWADVFGPHADDAPLPEDDEGHES